MKKLLYVLVFVLGTIIYGQTPNSYGQNPTSSFSGSQRVDLNHESNIKGNYYLFDSWNNGVLVMNDTLFFSQSNMRYDGYKDRILIRKGENLKEAFEINDIDLTGFSIFEEKNNLKHDFVKLKTMHFQDNVSSGYFEIISNNYKTNYVLKKTIKYIYDPNKSKGVAAQNNVQSEFKQKTSYFIKNDEGLYVKVRLKKKDVLNILTNNQAKVKSYLDTHTIHFNNEIEVTELVNYYYMLAD